MKNDNNFKFVTLVISAVLILNVMMNAQTSNSQKEKEHQAVKELILEKVRKSMRNNRSSDNEDIRKKKDVFVPLGKQQQLTNRKSRFMNGNKISVEIYNYGGIAPGYGLLRGANNYVWNNVDYLFQFCPIVGASVPNDKDPSKRLHIISDGLFDYTSPMLREVNPGGDTLWQWEPLEGYSDEEQNKMAANPDQDADGDGKPDSWPRDWYNPTLGKYVWPGFLSQDALSADLEAYWAMDDRNNREFPYYPFPEDHDRRGLGIQIDGRAFQWSNALAEDAIFFLYRITNVSSRDLDSVFFGIYGDPDLGGGSPENSDDNGFFVPPYSTDSVNVENIPVYARSLVYLWDPDMEGRKGLPMGYLGCKFLESPGNPDDGIDNDGDGMIDERQDDGIDNDGDWDQNLHDVGIDGIEGTNDEGEGDGVPTAGRVLADGSPDPLYPGEPNFEFTDLDEADQIGLTSFNSWTWSQDKIADDESMWNRCRPRNFGAIQQNTDLVFILASGYISLKAGESKRISMALLNGEDLDDLLTTSETVQRIYNENYQFFRPPSIPEVSAVPGDKKVTLYWDSSAEESVDPITGKDFEGYVIYRSTTPDFSDAQSITDGKGSGFLSAPLKKPDGTEAKWDVALVDEPFVDENGNGEYDQGEDYTDLNGDGIYTTGVEDPWKGYHPVPYSNRGVHYYLGENSGLVHSYVDSNNVINGQKYYYAVVAYDHGDSVAIPPTETTKKINSDPITQELTFDPNTVAVVPGPRAPGYETPTLTARDVVHQQGRSTGKIKFNILNDLEVKDRQYQISFSDSLEDDGKKKEAKNYKVLNTQPYNESVAMYGNKFSKLTHNYIAKDEFLEVKDDKGNILSEGTDFILNYDKGIIRRADKDSTAPVTNFTLQYRHYPIYQSQLLDGEDHNPTFDGIKLRVYDEPKIEYDSLNSQWLNDGSNYDFVVQEPSLDALPREIYPGDFEIEFTEGKGDTALVLIGGTPSKMPVNYKVREVTTGVPKKLLTILKEKRTSIDSLWNPGEEIMLYKPGATGTVNDTLTWSIFITVPQDTANAEPPSAGDKLFLATKRPFTKEDKYTFQTTPGELNKQKTNTKLDDIYVVPNPYVGYNDLEPANPLPGRNRGERRIYFENLPSQCTIRIFTMNGDLVRELSHDAGRENAREYWNLLNNDGFSVAYGVYFAHIDAPGIGEKIIKFAIIK